MCKLICYNYNYIPSSECSVNGLDLYFVLDESGSVTSPNYQLMKKFAQDTVSSFKIGPNNVQIGLISFSSAPRFHFYLNTFTTKSEVLNAIGNLHYSSGGTATAQALNALRILGYNRSTGARPASQGIPRVAIVVTDGKSNDPSATKTASTILHNSGIIVFAIGIAGANIQELNNIASKQSYVSFISNFSSDQLENLQLTLSSKACAGIN